MERTRKTLILPEKLASEVAEMLADMGEDFSGLTRALLRQAVLDWRQTRQRLYPEPKQAQGYAGRPNKPEAEKHIDKMIQQADAFFLKLKDVNPTAWDCAEPWRAEYEAFKAARNYDGLKVFNQETLATLAALRLMGAGEIEEFEAALALAIAQAKAQNNEVS